MPVPTLEQFTALVGRIAESDGQLGDLQRQLIDKYAAGVALLETVTASDAASKAALAEAITIFESGNATLTTVADNQDTQETTLKDVINPATPVPPVVELPTPPVVEPNP